MEFAEPFTERLDTIWTGLVKSLPMLAIALFVLLLTWSVARVSAHILRSSLQRSNLRPSLKELFVELMQVGVWVTGVLISITVIFPSMTPANLFTVLGLGSLAVGLAFKDIFENFFAGILIMSRKAMRIGDFIECEGVEGRVERIAVRETHIRQEDNQLVLVPNSFLFSNPLYILTDQAWRRFEIVVGVAYGEHVEAARAVILRALQGLDLVNQDKPIEVYAREFNTSSLDFTVRWWAKPRPLDMHQSRDKVVTAIKLALDEAGIEIPFPYRTLVFKEPVALRRDPSDEHGTG